MDRISAPRFIDAWFIFTRVCWAIIVALSVYTLFYIAFVLAPPDLFLNDVRHGAPLFPDSPLLCNLVLVLHILTGCPCVILGPFLFVPWLRNHCRALHRGMGKVYVVTVLFSAVAGFAMASVNLFGIVSRAGFMTLAVTWFSTTWIAYRKIRGGNWIAHRRWMIRSYAISIAVITVRFLAKPEGMSLQTWYPIMTWLCWVPNAMIAEIYVRITDEHGDLAYRNRTPRPRSNEES